MPVSNAAPEQLSPSKSTANLEKELADWIEFIQILHGRSIDLTLDRVRAVVERLGCDTVPYFVISVAGTNGKGSVASTVESILRSAGLRTGLYTSPHLSCFNERFKVDSRLISDAELVREFEIVDAARGSVPLTFFEFGTAIAIDYFRRSAVDAAIFEIGLGGRLDAVNVLDADIACITSIGTDHGKWLGSTREQVGYEKAGILRPGQLAVCTDPNPPQSVLDRARELSARLHVLGADFSHCRSGDGRMWQMRTPQRDIAIDCLPRTPLQGEFQNDNCAGAVAVAALSRSHFEISDDAIREGIAATSIEGRLQVIQDNPEILLDVAHNAEAAAALADHLASNPCAGRSIAVMSALSEKPIESMVSSVRAHFDEWHFCGIDQADRGISGEDLAKRATPLLAEECRFAVHETIHEAFGAALSCAQSIDRIVVFGSFFIVGDIIELYR